MEDKYKLNKEIAKLIDEKRYREIGALVKKSQEDFWSNEYPKKTFEEKINYWSGSFYQQMRWDGGAGIDPLSGFSQKAYLRWKESEPNLEEMLPFILKKLDFSEEKFYKLIAER